jgi:hypothetical protein
MKLHGIYILLLDYCGEFRAVGARGGRRAVRLERGIGVREIKIRSGVDACEQGRIALLFKLIPAHVRELYVWRQRADDSGEKIQTLELRSLFARPEQYLQSQADSQKRDAAMDGVDQRGAEFFFVEGANQRRVMTDAGKEQGVRVGNAFRRTGSQRFRSEALERALDGGNIAGAVIENSHFHNSPLVLGKIFRKRLSRVTAERKARANALNMAST